MSQTPRSSEDLLDLLADYCNGQLADDDAARLAQRLRDEEDSRAVYIRYMDIHSTLRWNRAPVPVNAEEEKVEQFSAPTPRSKSLMRWASRHPEWPSIALTVLVMVGLVGWAAVTYLPELVAGGGKQGSDQQKPAAEAGFVAWYMGARNAEWLDGTEPQKTRLKLGQKLAIEKGLIEIQYITGAEVVIEGPAEFFVGSQESGVSSRGRKPVDAANSGYLKHGKLVARVEGEDAKGFTIETPSGRVEDLGTEFGVFVDARQDATIHVFEGAVDLVSVQEGDGRRGTKTRLVANQTAQVSRTTGAVIAAEGLNARFVRRLASEVWHDVPIVNNSFESPRLDQKEPWRQDVTGWECSQNTAGVASFGSRYRSGTPDGQQVAYLHSGNFMQELSEELRPNTTYRLTMWVGNPPIRIGRPPKSLEPDYTVELRAGETVLVKKRNPVKPKDGRFLRLVLKYKSAASPEAVGQPLMIVLHAHGTRTTTHSQTHFDDIRLFMRETSSSQDSQRNTENKD